VAPDAAALAATAEDPALAGALAALTDPTRKAVVQGNLAFLNRQNFSFPPDHGARLVTMILDDEALKADWKAELEDVRLNMLSLRTQLAHELRRAAADALGIAADGSAANVRQAPSAAGPLSVSTDGTSGEVRGVVVCT
jgi:hypothetical protein